MNTLNLQQKKFDKILKKPLYYSKNAELFVINEHQSSLK